MKDFYGNKITLPSYGDKVLRDGYEFSVTEVRENSDINIIASIVLTGRSGSVEIGYYDYLNHKKA